MKSPLPLFDYHERQVAPEEPAPGEISQIFNNASYKTPHRSALEKYFPLVCFSIFMRLYNSCVLSLYS